MYSRKIKAKDYRGIEKEKVCYFNFTETEVFLMEAGTTESFSESLVRIMGTKNPEEIMATLKNFILDSYGEMDDDNNSFMKTPEIRKKFECSIFFNALFLDMIEHIDTFAPEFINGVLGDLKQIKIPENIPEIPDLSKYK